MILNFYFDESGKFADHEIVSFCGVVALREDLHQFNQEWTQLLRVHGLGSLSMKKALNHQRPLSEVIEATGIEERTKALLPFVNCMADWFELGIGVAVNVLAFKSLPSQTQRILGNDSHYVAFERTMHEISVHLVPQSHHASIVMDDEEKYSIECYKLLGRMKRARPEVKKKIVGIAFADDFYFPALQAADLLSSLTRLAARHKFQNAPFDYADLYNSLTVDAVRDSKIVLRGQLFDAAGLNELADKITTGRKGQPAVEHLGPE